MWLLVMFLKFVLNYVIFVHEDITYSIRMITATVEDKQLKSATGEKNGSSIFNSIVSRAINSVQDNAQDQPPVVFNPKARRITLYRNGFTVDDNPLRDLISIESLQFIAKLEKGEVPAGQKIFKHQHLYSSVMFLLY